MYQLLLLWNSNMRYLNNEDVDIMLLLNYQIYGFSPISKSQHDSDSSDVAIEHFSKIHTILQICKLKYRIYAYVSVSARLLLEH